MRTSWWLWTMSPSTSRQSHTGKTPPKTSQGNSPSPSPEYESPRTSYIMNALCFLSQCFISVSYCSLSKSGHLFTKHKQTGWLKGLTKPWKECWDMVDGRRGREKLGSPLALHSVCSPWNPTHILESLGGTAIPVTLCNQIHTKYAGSDWLGSFHCEATPGGRTNRTKRDLQPVSTGPWVPAIEGYTLVQKWWRPHPLTARTWGAGGSVLTRVFNWARADTIGAKLHQDLTQSGYLTVALPNPRSLPTGNWRESHQDSMWQHYLSVPILVQVHHCFYETLQKSQGL